MSNNQLPFLSLKNITKEFDGGVIKALSGVTLDLEMGKMYALKGASGSGKSTLLNIIGSLDSATSGTIHYNGKTLKELGLVEEFRRDFLGFIFQFHHLLPVLTLKENIESAMLFNPKYSKEQRMKRVDSLLQEFGLEHRKDSYASKISGGERQRGAIARAFANEPQLILADEPTGNVDSENSEVILQMMREYIKQSGATILIATHDPIVSAYADEIITMQDSKIVNTSK